MARRMVWVELTRHAGMLAEKLRRTFQERRTSQTKAWKRLLDSLGRVVFERVHPF